MPQCYGRRPLPVSLAEKCFQKIVSMKLLRLNVGASLFIQAKPTPILLVCITPRRYLLDASQQPVIESILLLRVIKWKRKEYNEKIDVKQFLGWARLSTSNSQLYHRGRNTCFHEHFNVSLMCGKFIQFRLRYSAQNSTGNKQQNGIRKDLETVEG